MAVVPVTRQAGSSNTATGCVGALTVATGDFVTVAIMSVGHTGSDALPSVSDSQGNSYTLGYESADRKVVVYYRTVTASSSTPTMTVSGCITFCLAIFGEWTGVSADSPFGLFYEEENASGDETCTSVTTSSDGGALAFHVMQLSTNNNVTAIAATNPTFAVGITQDSNASPACRFAAAYDDQATAGATGDITWSQTDSATRAFVFSLNPEGVAANVFFENRHPIEHGMKPNTAAGMGGVLIE